MSPAASAQRAEGRLVMPGVTELPGGLSGPGPCTGRPTASALQLDFWSSFPLRVEEKQQTISFCLSPRTLTGENLTLSVQVLSGAIGQGHGIPGGVPLFPRRHPGCPEPDVDRDPA